MPFQHTDEAFWIYLSQTNQKRFYRNIRVLDTAHRKSHVLRLFTIRKTITLLQRIGCYYNSNLLLRMSEKSRNAAKPKV